VKHPILEKIDRVLMSIGVWLSRIGAVCLIFVMCLAFFDAMASKFLRSSIPRATELVTYINVPIVFAGVAIVQLKEKHTTVDLIYGKFPRWLKKACCIVADLVGIGVCGYLAYLGLQYGASMQAKGNLSGAVSGFKLWPFATIMGIGWLTLGVSTLWSLIRLLFNLTPLPGTEEEEFMEATKHLPMEENAAEVNSKE
jgi:TRAP-type C4-dicarboxylate transport system permease small subunit